MKTLGGESTRGAGPLVAAALMLLFALPVPADVVSDFRQGTVLLAGKDAATQDRGVALLNKVIQAPECGPEVRSCACFRLGADAWNRRGDLDQGLELLYQALAMPALPVALRGIAGNVVQNMHAGTPAAKMLAAYEGVVKRHPELVVVMAPALSDFLVDTERSAEVAALWESVVKHCPADAAAQQLEAWRRLARARRAQAGNGPGEVAALQQALKLVDQTGAGESARTVAGDLRLELAAALLAVGEREGAGVQLAAAMQADPGRAAEVAGLLPRLGDQQKTADFAGVLTATMATPETAPAAALAAQFALGRLLVQLQRYDEALHVARTCLFSCYADVGRTPEAIDLVAAALKGRDGHLGNANRFLRFQRGGPPGPDNQSGTPDDLTDPLAAMKRQLPAVTAEQTRAGLAACPQTAEGQVRAARLHVLREDPESALTCLLNAFRLCPVDAKSVQDHANAVGQLIVQVLRDEAAATAMVNFLTYGTAGPDGKTGTPDDVADPEPRLRQQLQRCYQD